MVVWFRCLCYFCWGCLFVECSLSAYQRASLLDSKANRLCCLLKWDRGTWGNTNPGILPARWESRGMGRGGRGGGQWDYDGAVCSLRVAEPCRWGSREHAFLASSKNLRKSFLGTRGPSLQMIKQAPLGIVLPMNPGSRSSIITSVYHCQWCTILTLPDRCT